MNCDLFFPRIRDRKFIKCDIKHHKAYSQVYSDNYSPLSSLKTISYSFYWPNDRDRQCFIIAIKRGHRLSNLYINVILINFLFLSYQEERRMAQNKFLKNREGTKAKKWRMVCSHIFMNLNRRIIQLVKFC